MKDSERDELFARARKAATPSDGDRERVRGALARRVGMGAGALVATTAATKAAASVMPAASAAVSASPAATAITLGVSGATALKLVAGAVVVALVVGTALPVRRAPIAPATEAPSPVLTVSRAAGSARPLDVEVPRPRPLVPDEPVTAKEPAREPSASGPAPARAAPSLTPLPGSAIAGERPALEVPQPELLLGEVELMAEVQSALRTGDSARVLLLVREHERRFPDSAWLPEREGARVLARCAGASPGDARALGQQFLATYPGSPLSGRVHATCGVPSAGR